LKSFSMWHLPERWVSPTVGRAPNLSR